MNKEILERYATLKKEIVRIENEIQFLQPEVLKEVLEIRGETDKPVLLQDIGTFSIMKLKKWVFSPLVNDLKKKLDDKKKEEQRTGEATFEELETVVFRELK